jgi:tetratricopeptide (TPR) repeat protein
MSKMALRAAIPLLLLALVACAKRDPVAVVKQFVTLRLSYNKHAYVRSYAMLTDGSRGVTPLDRYTRICDLLASLDSALVAGAKAELAKRKSADSAAESQGVKPKKRRQVISGARLIPSDPNQPEYRRVRIETTLMSDSSGVPTVSYYTVQEQKGRWRVVWAQTYLDSASKLFNAGSYAEASLQCDLAISLNPYSADAYDRKAWCFARTHAQPWEDVGSLTDSVEYNARRALELEPDIPDRYNTLALAQRVPELRIECYKKGAASRFCSRSTRAVLYGNIANTFIEIHDAGMTAVYAESALAIDSTNCFALLQLGVAKKELDGPAVAVVQLRKGLADATNWGDKALRKRFFSVLAEYEYETGEYDSAMSHVLRALDISPSKEISYTHEDSLYQKIKRARRQ